MVAYASFQQCCSPVPRTPQRWGHVPRVGHLVDSSWHSGIGMLYSVCRSRGHLGLLREPVLRRRLQPRHCKWDNVLLCASGPPSCHSSTFIGKGQAGIEHALLQQTCAEMYLRVFYSSFCHGFAQPGDKGASAARDAQEWRHLRCCVAAYSYYASFWLVWVSVQVPQGPRVTAAACAVLA